MYVIGAFGKPSGYIIVDTAACGRRCDERLQLHLEVVRLFRGRLAQPDSLPAPIGQDHEDSLAPITVIANAGHRSQPSINVTPLSDANHQDKQHAVLNLIDHSVVAAPNTVQLIFAGQLDRSHWTRVIGQGLYHAPDAEPVGLGDARQGLDR
jgi:hypothetical protein